jgi:hypothetical protein
MAQASGFVIPDSRGMSLQGERKEWPDERGFPDVASDAQIVPLREFLALLDSWTERNGA